jgi:hypothetical protein
MVQLAKKRFMGRATAFAVAPRYYDRLDRQPRCDRRCAVHSRARGNRGALARLWHGGRRPVPAKGQVAAPAVRAAHVTEHDLREDLRGKGVSDLSQVKDARLERSGNLSVIRSSPAPQVLDVAVEDSVQTIRIEIGGGLGPTA